MLTFSLFLKVFDSPHLKLLVGKRTRRRLDTKSIVQLLKSFDAPVGMLYYYVTVFKIVSLLYVYLLISTYSGLIDPV